MKAIGKQEREQSAEYFYLTLVAARGDEDSVDEVGKLFKDL